MSIEKAIEKTRARFEVVALYDERFNPETGETEWGDWPTLLPVTGEVDDLVEKLIAWIGPTTKYRKMTSRGMITIAVIVAFAVSETRMRGLRVRLLVDEVLLGLALCLLGWLVALG